MSSIDDLIAEHCPNGVVHVPLMSIGTWYGGGTPSKDRPEFWNGGTIPWLSPKDMGPRTIEKTEDYITEAAVRHSATKLVPAGSVAIVVRSSILDRVLPTALLPIPIALNQDMKAVAPANDVLPDYLAHLLSSEGPEILRRCRRTGGSVASIDTQKLFAYCIPVPPIEIQREIVAILDKFTKLEAELEAELEARRIQYTYYRDSLLVSESWPTSLFGDVAKIARGASPRPIQSHLSVDSDSIPWIKIGDIDPIGKYVTNTAERITPAGAKRSKRVAPGDFLLSNSMSFGRPYISKIDGCIHDGWLAISNYEQSFRPDFLYHLLRSSSVQAEFARRAGSSTVSNLNAEIVRSVTLPVPHFDEQDRITKVLDRLDALTNDLSIGLPAELAARRKQYEYYRDKLLTFKELQP